jgi:hypothetical protein
MKGCRSAVRIQTNDIKYVTLPLRITIGDASCVIPHQVFRFIPNIAWMWCDPYHRFNLPLTLFRAIISPRSSHQTLIMNYNDNVTIRALNSPNLIGRDEKWHFQRGESLHFSWVGSLILGSLPFSTKSVPPLFSLCLPGHIFVAIGTLFAARRPELDRVILRCLCIRSGGSIASMAETVM